MSEKDYVDQFLELIKMSELNEAEAVLLILELAGIPMRTYVYKHDTKTGNPHLETFNKMFADYKTWVEEQEKAHFVEGEKNG